MIVDFGAPILTLKGKQYRELDEDVTVGGIVTQLVSVLPTDAAIQPSARKARFLLTIRIMNATEPLEITEAEKTMIEELINKGTMPPLYAEQVSLALDGKPNPLIRPKLSIVPEAVAK